MSVAPGDQLLHYRIVEKLGEGGMGAVWRAVDTNLGREVAIKVLPREVATDPERLSRFRREARTVAGLNHPNIVTIYSVEEAEGIRYLTMELVVGRSIQELLPADGFPVDRLLALAVPIARAVASAHEHGVVHRDLKPGNVMVADDGDRVKVLDFGLAKVTPGPGAEGRDEDGEAATLTRTREGAVFGTPYYMSPEQARGSSADPRSDVFSLGVMLFEMASGRRPFRGANLVEVLSAVLKDPAPDLTEIRPDLPPALVAIIERCLQKEPEDRYPDARQLASDLEALRDTPSSSSRDGAAAVPSAREAAPVDRDDPSQAARAAPLPATDAPKPRSGSPARSWILATLALAVVAALALWIASRWGASATPPGTLAEQSAAEGPRRIVVLPFENLGPPDDAYFAAGMTEEIIGQLASVPGVAPISRTSAFQYDKSGKSMQQIGRDFGAEHVLEGTVRWARDADGTSRVRISPQLVRVADDTSMWAETYDRPMDDIFRIQSEIAGQVIEALGILLPGGALPAADAPAPTDSQEAYQAYLRGQQYLIVEPWTEKSVQLFERAVELDPDFAAAWAALSRAHSYRFHYGDRTETRGEAARTAAEESLRLAPDAASSYLASALYHYRCFRDFETATKQIRIAARLRPNDVDVISWEGTFHKRQGQLAEAVEAYRRVITLDPRRANELGELSLVHRWLRDFEESERYSDRSLAVAPDRPHGYLTRGWLYFNWKGDAAAVRDVLSHAPQSREVDILHLLWFLVDLSEGRCGEALAELERRPDFVPDQTTLNSRAVFMALCHEDLGAPDRARESWSEAVRLLELETEKRPEDFRAWADLGLALAGLGRSDEALAAVGRSRELMPLSKDFEAAGSIKENAALVEARLGRLDAAFDLLEELLEEPSDVSIARLRLDPRWGELTRSPRFAELEQRFASR